MNENDEASFTLTVRISKADTHGQGDGNISNTLAHCVLCGRRNVADAANAA